MKQIINLQIFVLIICMNTVFNSSVLIAAAAGGGAGGAAAFAASMSEVSPRTAGRHLFEESAIWVPTLNTSYRGVTLEDDVDRWHSQCHEVIRMAKASLPAHNIAVARLGVIYQSKEGTLYRHYVDLPYIYLSGWDAEKPREGIGEAEYRIVKGKVLACFNRSFPDVYKEFASIKQSVEGDERDKDLKYATTLREIYDFSYTDLPHENMKKRVGETLTTLLDTVCTREGMNSNNADFAKRFYDTEQGVYFKLQNSYKEGSYGPMKRLEIGDPTIPSLLHPVTGDIYYLTLDIATFTDICMDCSDTGLMQSRFYKGFVEALKEKIVGTAVYGKKYTIKRGSDLNSFIRVSSTASTSKQKTRKSESYANVYGEDGTLSAGDHKGLLTGYMIDDFLNPSAFEGYIAQMEVKRGTAHV